MLRNSIRLLVATSLLFVGFTSFSEAQEGAREGDLLLVGATVIDGTGAEAITDAWIHVKEGRIEAVGENEPPRVPGAEVLELQGKSVIPGLADMHVHLRHLENARWVLKALLAHGIVVVQETGNSLGSIAAIQRWIADQDAVPNYHPANSPLQGSSEDLRFLRSGEEVASKMEDYAAFGLEFVKVYNFLSSMGLVQAGELAEEHDIRIIGHTPLSGTSVAAFDAGIEIMQHLRLRPYEVLDDLELIAEYPIDELLMKRTGFWAHFDPDGRNLSQTLDLWEERKGDFFVTPTLVAQEAVANAYDYPEPASKFEEKRGAEFVSERMLSAWREISPPDEQWGELNPKELAEARQTLDGMASFVGLAHERGIRILSGTDTPVPWVVPGVSLHEELQHFVEKSGMTPEEAIHTSTGQAAAALETSDRGTVEAGKVADLVIVDGDVADDISTLANIETVILGGRVYSHEQLMDEVDQWAARDTVENEK